MSVNENLETTKMNAFSKFETVPADEADLIQSIESLMRRKLEKDYAAGNTKRGAHPKTGALLQAEFIVESDLPDELKVGIFQHPKTYASWLRLSSSEGKVKSDKVKDLRGFAIKLFEVDGEKFAKADEKQTQDFVMISMPTMPLGTVKLFHDAIYYTLKWSPIVFLLRTLFSGRLNMLKEVGKYKKNQTSPLDIRYWSTTPYLFGADRAVKYTVVPTSEYRSSLPAKLTDSYLTDNVEAHLAKHEASFDFMVQFQKDPILMPIEDASVEWKEQESPFVKVATIQIPTQAVRTDERKELAENFSFSPGQALVEHQPIGGLNRARTEIYWRLSVFRHQRNKKKMSESIANREQNLPL